MNRKQLAWSVKRAMCGRVLKGEWTVEQAAKATGRTVRTIQRWLEATRERQGGPEAADKPEAESCRQSDDGNPDQKQACTLGKEVRGVLDQVMARRPNLRRRSLQEHVRRHYGLELPRRQISAYLREKGVLSKPSRRKIIAPPRRFEASAPMQMVQVDIFYIPRRDGEFFYGLSVLDDHSRMALGVPVLEFQGARDVLEAFTRVIESWVPPARVLTDQGAQFVTWKGRTAFQDYVEDELWATHIVASKAHPETLGKVERFHRTLREEALVDQRGYRTSEDAQRVLDHYLGYYNYVRPHEGLNGLTPADRFYGLAQPLKATLPWKRAAGGLYLVLSMSGRRLVVAGESPERLRILWDDHPAVEVPHALPESGKGSENPGGTHSRAKVAPPPPVPP